MANLTARILIFGIYFFLGIAVSIAQPFQIKKTESEIRIADSIASITYSQNPMNASYKGSTEGEHIHYFLNGKITTKYFIKNGNLQGDRISYYQNGDLFVVEPFDKGTFHGVVFALNKKKDTIYIEIYKHDTLLFTKNFYYSLNGKLKQIFTTQFKRDRSLIINPFFNTIETNRSFWFNNTYLEENVNNNQISVVYYKTGVMKGYFEMSKNKYHGKYQKYYENGQIKVDAVCADNLYSGKYLEYYSNGQIKIDANCANDLYQGKFTEYNSNGKVVKERVYDMGIIMKRN